MIRPDETAGAGVRISLRSRGVGPFTRNRAPSPLTVSENDLYEVIAETLTRVVPSSPSTVTPHGVILLMPADRALLLRVAGPTWEIGVYDTSAGPQRMVQTRLIPTKFTRLQTAELVVSVLDLGVEFYNAALASGALTAEATQWLSVRRDEFQRALEAGPQ